MKCSGCKFYVKSRTYGNSCSCRGTKPCDVARIKAKREHGKKVERKRRERYAD